MATSRKTTRRKKIGATPKRSKHILMSHISYEEMERMGGLIKRSTERKFEDSIREMLEELSAEGFDDDRIYLFIMKLTEYHLEPYGYEG